MRTKKQARGYILFGSTQEKTLTEIVEQMQPALTEPPISYVKQLYDTCMDTGTSLQSSQTHYYS